MKKFNINDQVTDGIIVGKIKDYRKIREVYYYYVETLPKKRYMICENELERIIYD
jgi:nitrogen regulatory protein PII-like uncharacterized protein